MIPFFDQFIDTKEKRYHLLLLMMLLGMIWILVPYILLALQLISLDNYTSLYALLKKPQIEWTLISRIIVDAISMAHLSIPNVLSCVLQNFQATEMVMGMLLLLSFGILEKKRVTTICLLSLVVEVFTTCILAFIAMQAGTLQTVIDDIRYIGMLMLIINGMLLLIAFYHLLQQIKKYHTAMQYQVCEIKEHMDEKL